MAKTLYIIDGHAHIYAAYYAPMRQQLSSPTGEPTKATYIFTTALLGLIEKHKPDLVAVAMDSKTPTIRAAVYPQYKANRPPMPADLPVQIARIKEILDAMRIPVLSLDGYEADDIIGTLAKKAAADGFDVRICSGDNDILQLICGPISVFEIKSGEVIDSQTMKQKMGIDPKQIIDCLALEGDAIDNVPGVPLIGEKTARELIRQYGDLDNLYAHAEEIKGKRGENLRNYREQAYLSRSLVTLNCDVPIKFDYEDLAFKGPDKERLSRIYNELGFNRLLAQLNLSNGPNRDATVSETSTNSARTASSGASPPARDYSVRASSATVPHEYTLVDTTEKFSNFVCELRKQKLISVDTETTSVNAMRAELVGLSFCWQPGRAFYLPVRGPLGSSHLDIEMIRRELGPLLADESVRKIGQNLKYDMLVLRNARMPVRGVYFDTMVASYVLDPERLSHSMDSLALDLLNYECIPIVSLLGKGKNQLTFDLVDLSAAAEYSAEDADITYQLYLCLKDRLERQPSLDRLFHEVEMPLVEVLADMEYTGISINTALLRQMSDELEQALNHVAEQIYRGAGMVFNVDSPKQLAEVLFDKLKLQAPRLGKAARSTDAEVLEQLSDQSLLPGMVLEYRSLGKLKNTYVDALGVLVHPRTGRVHTSFNQTVTATGRLSSSNPNLQNIPIRTELGRRIRGAFIPQNPGDVILSADYSQIELRLLAHFSKDEALRAAFAADQDIHRFVASQIYGVPLEQVTSEQRSRCKTVNFGIIYGQGALGLARNIGMTTAEARQFIDQYFARYGSIRVFIEECIDKAKRKGYAETILGRRRRISDLRSTNPGRRAQAERLAVNTVIQGSAADLIKVAMIRVHRRIQAENLALRMLLQVHDELVFETSAAEVEQHAKWIAEEMVNAIRFDVPLKVDTKFGPSWLSDK